MTSTLMIFGAGINALAFFRINCAFSKSGYGDVEAECKHHDLAEQNLFKAKEKMEWAYKETTWFYQSKAAPNKWSKSINQQHWQGNDWVL